MHVYLFLPHLFFSAIELARSPFTDAQRPLPKRRFACRTCLRQGRLRSPKRKDSTLKSPRGYSREIRWCIISFLNVAFSLSWDRRILLLCFCLWSYYYCCLRSYLWLVIILGVWRRKQNKPKNNINILHSFYYYNCTTLSERCANWRKFLFYRSVIAPISAAFRYYGTSHNHCCKQLNNHSWYNSGIKK